VSGPLAMHPDAARALTSMLAHAETIEESRDAVAEAGLILFLTYLAMDAADGALTVADATEIAKRAADSMPRKFVTVLGSLERTGGLN
jgi:hypothetical protein